VLRFDVIQDDFDAIAASAMRASSTRGNPVSLAEDDFRAVLAEAV
jgi:alcohol dehydrogenase class IV